MENDIVLILLKHFTLKFLRAAGKIAKVTMVQLQRPWKAKVLTYEGGKKKKKCAILEGYSTFCFLTMHHMALLIKRKSD